MKRVFFRTCLFLLASIFLFENAGFITHELALAAGLVFLAALVISYLPLKTERASVPGIALGVILMIVAVAAMPGEFLRPGALALFLLGTSLLVRGFNGEAPELPLFSVTAAGYGLYMFLSRADVHVWRWVKSLSFAFSNLVAALTAALPGTKALLGPAFIGAGVIVTFALLFIVGSFFLKENRLRKAAKALGAMVLIIAIYAVAFTYAPSAFKFQIKMGPTPSEEEKSTVRQASEQYYGKHLDKIPRLETEKQTKIIFSADTLIVDHCALWAPFALGLLFLLPTYYFFKGAELHAIPLSSSTLFSAGGVVLLFAMALGETSHLRSGSQEELKKAISEKRVGFYMHGFANWMRPSFKSFGSRSSGMFGNLPDFVESMGFRQPAPDLEPNGRNRQIPLPARNEALRRLNIEKEKPKRPTRDQNAYIDSGALLTEITPQTLEGVDVLMLLNINGLLNSEDPTRLPYHSPMQRARTALWKRYEQISKQIDAIRREDFPARVKQLTAKDEKAAEQQKELIKQARAELKVLEQQLTAPVDETPTITMQQTGMQMQLDKLAEQLADLRGQVKNARGEIDVPTEDQIQRRARLLEEQGALRDDQATMMPKMIELATMRNELQTKRNDLARRRRELAKRARELDKSELAALEQELDQAKKELDEREKERQSNYGDTEQDWQQLRVSQVALITQMETLVNEERKLALPRTTLENQLEALVRQQEQLAGKNEDLLSTKAELDPGGKKLRELADLVKPQSGPTDLQEVFELPKKLDELEKRLISLQERWHKDALEVIWDFVADGGALLVIGDILFTRKPSCPWAPRRPSCGSTRCSSRST
ncbi:MAG: hypothetical protein HQ592_10515 [Planctomycetes bacterium]|nr:hypothetical protein [Planctomycetota bacterium]